MNIELNNETLTKYVLDELDATKREAVEALLQENPEAQAQVAELRASAGLLEAALREGKDFALDDKQRTAILAKAGRASRGWGSIPRGVRRWAAVILVSVGVGVPGVVYLGQNVAPGMYSGDLAMRSELSESAGAVAELQAAKSARRGRSSLGVPWSFGKAKSSIAEGAPVAQFDVQFENIADPFGPPSSGGFDPTAGLVDNSNGDTLAVEMVGGIEFLYAQAPPQASTATTATTPPEAGMDRYLIRNVSLVIEAVDARLAKQTLVQAAKDLGGYVSSLHESVDGLGRPNITLQLRVPSAKLDALLPDVEGTGKVLDKQLSTQDVTEEYIDTESRVRNLRKAEERLIEHLDRTGELKDIVLIENEINSRREQIERLEGRIKYLSHRIAFSTVNVSLREKPGPEPKTPPAGFSSAKVFSEAMRDLVGAARTVWTCMIWAAVWSVVWAPILLALWAWGSRFGVWRHRS